MFLCGHVRLWFIYGMSYSFYGIHFCDIHCICVWLIDMCFISIYDLFMSEYLFDICMC